MIIYRRLCCRVKFTNALPSLYFLKPQLESYSINRFKLRHLLQTRALYFTPVSRAQS